MLCCLEHIRTIYPRNHHKNDVWLVKMYSAWCFFMFSNFSSNFQQYCNLSETIESRLLFKGNWIQPICHRQFLWQNWCLWTCYMHIWSQYLLLELIVIANSINTQFLRTVFHASHSLILAMSANFPKQVSTFTHEFFSSYFTLFLNFDFLILKTSTWYWH